MCRLSSNEIGLNLLAPPINRYDYQENCNKTQNNIILSSSKNKLFQNIQELKDFTNFQNNNFISPEKNQKLAEENVFSNPDQNKNEGYFIPYYENKEEEKDPKTQYQKLENCKDQKTDLTQKNEENNTLNQSPEKNETKNLIFPSQEKYNFEIRGIQEVLLISNQGTKLIFDPKILAIDINYPDNDRNLNRYILLVLCILIKKFIL